MNIRKVEKNPSTRLKNYGFVTNDIFNCFTQANMNVGGKP